MDKLYLAYVIENLDYEFIDGCAVTYEVLQAQKGRAMASRKTLSELLAILSEAETLVVIKRKGKK